MNNLLLKTISLMIITIILYGCVRKEVDLIPPTIEIVSFNPTPAKDRICGSLEENVFKLEGGEKLHFNLVFRDNETLAQYKIVIHNNFDCHGHGGGIAPSIVLPNVDNQTEDWSVQQINDISGSLFSVIDSIVTPKNVTAGNYHFHIQVIDESGNDNPFSNFYSIKVKNPTDSVPPTIKIDEPSLREFSALRSSAINFKGDITDNFSLSSGGNGVLYLAYTDLSSGNTFSTDVAFYFDETIDKNFDFNFEYIIPKTLRKGDYRFSIGVNDGVRNQAAIESFIVHVE